MSKIRRAALTIYTIYTPEIGYLRNFQFRESKFFSWVENYSEVQLFKDFDDIKAGLRKESYYLSMLLSG